MVLGSTAIGLVVSGCTPLMHAPPRPPIAQLMQDAIDLSAETRAAEAMVVENRSFSELSAPLHPEPFPPSLSQDGTAAGSIEQAVLHEDGTEHAILPTSIDEVLPVEGTINEEFIDTDVREAIAILASESEIDILMDDAISGVVNTTIEGATFKEALEKVLLPLGYVFGKRGEQYVISPPDANSPLFPFVSTHLEYKPLHLDAKSLLAAPPRQMVKYVREVKDSNTLVIEAPTQYAGMILDRIRQLDQPVPQVELEAIICVVAPDSSFRFGLDWGHAVTLNGNEALNLGMTGLGFSGVVSPTGVSNAFSDFATTSAFVKLLAENGYLTIRASPRVMAEHGKKANISIGRKTFFTNQPVGNNGNNNGAFFVQQNIEEVETGISLVITPRVRGDLVTVEIEKAEVSEDIRQDTTQSTLPVINRRQVSTTVHVQDGKTIVIGGLMQRETVDRANHVPGLSRLPGMGYLFKSVERQAREAEVVIFIAPRIVHPTRCATECELPASPHQALPHSEIAPDELPTDIVAHP